MFFLATYLTEMKILNEKYIKNLQAWTVKTAQLFSMQRKKISKSFFKNSKDLNDLG